MRVRARARVRVRVSAGLEFLEHHTRQLGFDRPELGLDLVGTSFGARRALRGGLAGGFDGPEHVAHHGEHLQVSK